MYRPEEHSQAISVTVTGMVLDLVLSALKIGGGVLTQSFALITDGIHSLSDAATDLFVLLVHESRTSRQTQIILTDMDVLRPSAQSSWVSSSAAQRLYCSIAAINAC